MLEVIKEKVEPIVLNHGLILVSVEQLEDLGVNLIRITVDNPESFDVNIDDVSEITKEALDEINDLIPDGYYLEVTSMGIERVLKTDEDLTKAIGKYVYLKLKQSNEVLKNTEAYGDLLSFDEECIKVNCVIKTRRKEINFKKEEIKLIRLAVKF